MAPVRIPDLRRALLRARRQLLRTVATTDAELEALDPRVPGDSQENASTRAEVTVLATLEEGERREVDAIDRALARIAAGTYGLCERCGGTIPVTRLRAMPATPRCLTCATRAAAS